VLASSFSPQRSTYESIGAGGRGHFSGGPVSSCSAMRRGAGLGSVVVSGAPTAILIHRTSLCACLTIRFPAPIGVVTGYWLVAVCLRKSYHCSAGVCDVDIVAASSAGFELKLKVSSFCSGEATDLVESSAPVLDVSVSSASDFDRIAGEGVDVR
jgi:hypothetical protein